MGLGRIIPGIRAELHQLEHEDLLKQERVVTKLHPPEGNKGYRVSIEGFPRRQFLRFNSNSYLGLNLLPEVEKAEQNASKAFGVGPGAVRFISGTYGPHIRLEMHLAGFHSKGACMLFSSAYAAVCGTLVPLINEKTYVLSDELNHNCIINAIRLAKVESGRKIIYPHLNYVELKAGLERCKGLAKEGVCERVLIVTDGVFSMRGDIANLAEIQKLADDYNAEFKDGVVTIVDDSHGVAACGKTGRGSCELTGASPDIIISTLGKGLGVNGGYVASDSLIIDYLRQKSPFYIYSNPITAGEAAAADAALSVLESEKGRDLLSRLSHNTAILRKGLEQLGLEIIPGNHPIVAVLLRDKDKMKKIITGLFERNILAVGLGYPIVPRGQETIRFQVSALHTAGDIDELLAALREILRDFA